MEQRPLRLGDIVDDYCPRERRITNHAIVALVDQSIRQTRCTTCDTEHPYKEARVPRRRKKDDGLYEQVLAEVAPGARGAPADAADDDDRELDEAPPMAAEADSEGDEAPRDDGPDAGDGEPAAPQGEDLWSGHRPLIRATLPRSENDEPTPRPIPEFTMHQRAHRGGGQSFRHGQGNANTRNGFRHGRSGQGQGQGQGNGDPQGQGGRPHRGGRGRHRGQNKRSR